MEEDGQRSGAQSRVASASAAEIFENEEGQEDEETMPIASPSALVSTNVWRRSFTWNFFWSGRDL